MNEREPGPNEIKATVARAYSSDVIGSQPYDAAIMISFIKEKQTGPDASSKFLDVFLDRSQAEDLYRELAQRLGLR